MYLHTWLLSRARSQLLCPHSASIVAATLPWLRRGPQCLRQCLSRSDTKVFQTNKPSSPLFGVLGGSWKTELLVSLMLVLCRLPRDLLVQSLCLALHISTKPEHIPDRLSARAPWARRHWLCSVSPGSSITRAARWAACIRGDTTETSFATQ